MLGLCTRLRDSAFKRSLAELEVGDEVEVEEPKGTFLLPEDTSKQYVFIAGGIGITVFRCMLRYIADKGLPHQVTLVYSNRDRESTAFLDELQELEQTLPGLRLVLTMTDDPGWEGETRMIDAERAAGAPRRPRPAHVPRRRAAADGRGGGGRAARRRAPGGASAPRQLQRVLVPGDLRHSPDRDQRPGRRPQPAQDRDELRGGAGSRSRASAVPCSRGGRSPTRGRARPGRRCSGSTRSAGRRWASGRGPRSSP